MVPSRSFERAPEAAGDGPAVPVASMVESIIGCKWSVRLLELCAGGCRRPSALLRACPGLSAKVMNERLRKLIRFGVIQRRVFGDKPPVEVEYRLTPFGLRFSKILDEVRRLQSAVDRGRVRAAARLPAGAPAARTPSTTMSARRPAGSGPRRRNAAGAPSTPGIRCGSERA